MRRVVINLQNAMFADAIERILRDDGDFAVINVRRPDEVPRQCELTLPEVVLMEVTAYTPWKLAERLKLREEILYTDPHCKLVLLVDEDAEQHLAEQVMQAKRSDLIDGFVFSSVSATYLSALLQTV